MKALIVVDAQYDFMPASEYEYENKQGGALAVKGGDEIIPVINDLLKRFNLVIFTKDWHPEKMEAFASPKEGKQPFEKYTNSKGKEDTLWPVHCVQNTKGADLHGDIDLGLIKGDFYIFKKGMKEKEHPYSGFGAEELEEFLKEKEVHQVFVCGLALDFCVKDTALDAAKKGFNTVVVLDGTRAISGDGVKQTMEEFLDNNIKVIESWELPLFNLM
jgi:nicotinamidase/pyrazinamidase